MPLRLRCTTTSVNGHCSAVSLFPQTCYLSLFGTRSSFQKVAFFHCSQRIMSSTVAPSETCITMLARTRNPNAGPSTRDEEDKVGRKLPGRRSNGRRTLHVRQNPNARPRVHSATVARWHIDEPRSEGTLLGTIRCHFTISTDVRIT